MTSREYKYLKADRHLTFFGDVFPVPNKHWHLRRRTARMSHYEYMRWKNQQGNHTHETDATLRTVDIQLSPEFTERIEKAFNKFTENLKNAKPND